MRRAASAAILSVAWLLSACPAEETDGLGPTGLAQNDAGGGTDAAMPDGLAQDVGGLADAAGPRDAALKDVSGPDAGSPDVVSVDTGLPPPDTSLGEGLACSLNNDEQLRAAVRFVACTANTQATVPALVEAFDAGLMGNASFMTRDWVSFNVAQGCGFWQCAAAADSCAEFNSCQPDELDPLGECDPDSPGAVSCVGDVISYCSGQGPQFIADCSVYGAECRNAACQKDGCTFGRGPDTGLRCSDDLSKLEVRCDGGTFEMACGDWIQGSSCTYFAIQGELPINWCSPNGQPKAGAYTGLVGGACGHGAFLFDTVTRGYSQFDCLSEGFDGCNPDGSGCRSL